MYALCAAGVLAVLSGCAADAAADVRVRKQLATLELIETLERDTAAFAASRAGVHSAEAYIRENTAVVLLSPADRAGVPARTIAEVSAYVAERTGLAEDRIVIKMRDAPTRGTTP
ncbi:MAG TPA: hypothetical protein DCM87_16890 [Planctomycetes bacterium]|nr:hypothetical protein [Planctomycetota bacterium]